MMRIRSDQYSLFLKKGQLFLLATTFFVLFVNFSLRADYRSVIVIIDGARYSETFGDSSHTYIPVMWNLAPQGSYLTQFYNDSITYTSRAIPALWCGSWTAVRDTFYNGSSTQYSLKPSLFEYYRRQKSRPAEDCFYVLKYISSLWLPSFHYNYGPPTWPGFHSQGSTDQQVAYQTEWVMNTYHPKFLWVYLADVDGAGHSGNWSNYTQAIQTADNIVGTLWNKIQSDPFYQDSTYLFVTNDHGRHDDLHGGFSGHGCGCEGCRHIMFLALGPTIKTGFISHQYSRIPDLAVTACNVLILNPEYATGEVIDEIFTSVPIISGNEAAQTAGFALFQNYPNPFNPVTRITLELPQPGYVSLKVYNALGEEVASLLSSRLVGTTGQAYLPAGFHTFEWEATGMASGVYLYRLEVVPLSGNLPGFAQTKKMLFIQ
jgi:hypothetical protein